MAKSWKLANNWKINLLDYKCCIKLMVELVKKSVN